MCEVILKRVKDRNGVKELIVVAEKDVPDSY